MMDKKLDRIDNGLHDKGGGKPEQIQCQFCFEKRFPFIEEALKEIKSHYYTKSEVERVIDKHTYGMNALKVCNVEDLKTELQKLGER